MLYLLLFIILIFLEIILTYFLIVKIIELDKKIQKWNAIVVEKGIIITRVHIEIQKLIHKVNTVVRILTSKKLKYIRKTLSITLSIIELIIILKSFKFRKGVKFNLRNVRKLLFTRISRQILKSMFNKFVFAQ